MGDLVLTVSRDREKRVMSDLVQRGFNLGWEYRGSLSDQLSTLNSAAVLRDQPYRFHRVAVADGSEISAAVRMQLVYDPERSGVFEAEPDAALTYSGLPFRVGGFHQSYLSRMNVNSAHQLGVLGQGVNVAVVDSGQDGVASYGAVRDYYDVESAAPLHPSPPTPVDRDGHGTAMAELIRSVAPAADIYVIRISGKLNQKQPPTLWNVLAGASLAAYDCDAEIINLSLGYQKLGMCPTCRGTGLVRSLALQKLLESITTSDFRIYVAAVGNESWTTGFNRPAEFSDAVAVGSVNSNDYRSTFSNYGSANHPYYLMAPGGEENPATVVTEDVGKGGTIPPNSCYGTSVATAFVSGMLALLRSDNRHRSQNRSDFLRDVVKNYCKRPSHAIHNQAEYGAGIIAYIPPVPASNQSGGNEEGSRIDADETGIRFSGSVHNFRVGKRK